MEGLEEQEYRCIDCDVETTVVGGGPICYQVPSSDHGGYCLEWCSMVACEDGEPALTDEEVRQRV